MKVYANGKLVYDDFQVIPGPVTLKLQRTEKSTTEKPHAPEPDILVTEQKEIPPSRNTKFALRVKIQATKTIQPVHLRVHCNGPLVDVDLQEPQRLVEYSYGVIPGETDVAEITFVFPPIDSSRPVVIVLFSNQQIRVTDVRNVY